MPTASRRLRGRETAVLKRSSPSAAGLDRGRSIAAFNWQSSTNLFTRRSGFIPMRPKLATDADFQELEKLAKRPKVIAWGEIGLDYFYDHSPRELQQQVFLKQMELARAAKLPIVIHCRPSDKSENAWDDCLQTDGTELANRAGWEEFCTASPEAGRTLSGRWISDS